MEGWRKYHVGLLLKDRIAWCCPPQGRPRRSRLDPLLEEGQHRLLTVSDAVLRLCTLLHQEQSSSSSSNSSSNVQPQQQQQPPTHNPQPHQK